MEYFKRILDFGDRTTYNLENNYKDLLDFVKGYVEADCYQVMVDNETVFHDMNNLTIRQNIMEQLIRNQIIADPHRSLFCPMLRKNQCFTVEIYLFQSTPWKIVIDYNFDDKMFHIKRMVSQPYIDKYEII